MNSPAKINCLFLPGDGIGPEVVTQAERCLQKLCELEGITLELSYAPLGGAAYDKHKDPCPAETLAAAAKADAILLGAVGGPKWDDLPMAERPEKGLLRLRSEFDFFANYRPVKLYDSLAAASPLRADIISGVDLLILRELVGGIYFGEPRAREDNAAYNTMRYERREIERLAHLAFAAARQRRKVLHSVDKANVLEVSALWREVVTEIAKEYPDVELQHLYVDNAAMQLILRPADFDVIVTGNLFGDILSDLGAQIAGSIGILPSASLNAERKGLYEPVHGSAPDIAGTGKANPLAMILSVAMMLKYSFGLDSAAARLEAAVAKTLAEGWRSQDLLLGDKQDKIKQADCGQMGEAVLANL